MKLVDLCHIFYVLKVCLIFLFIFRLRKRPIVTDHSRGPSVGLWVCLSSRLWKNASTDPDAVWRGRSNGSRAEAGSGVWGPVHGKGSFCGRIWGLCNVPVRKCVNRRSCGLGWCVGSAETLLRSIGVHIVQGEGGGFRSDTTLFPNYFGQTCYSGNVSVDLRIRPINRQRFHLHCVSKNYNSFTG